MRSGRKAARQPQHGTEESTKLKRKLLLSILAVIPAAFLPLAATCQIAPDYETPSAARAEPSTKYEVFAGYGYTSLNQVNESRHGLQGVNLSVTRDWGQYFGLTADGAYYPSAVGSGNPGNPTVTVLLFGPVVRAHLLGRYSIFVHMLVGGEHTGGEPGGTPKVSFAASPGIGMDYKLNTRFSLRLSGDDVISSYTEDPYHLQYSPHEHGNSRVAFGVVYRF
jgi:hypothetical protein